MRIGRRTALGGLIGMPALAPVQKARAQETPANLRDLARRATIYLFPVYEMYRARWRATVDESNASASTASATYRRSPIHSRAT